MLLWSEAPHYSLEDFVIQPDTQPIRQSAAGALMDEAPKDSLSRPTGEEGPETRGNILFAQIVAWATKGGFAILDQGLISGSNFLIGILLARWMAPASYGAYALAFSVFLLLAMLYQSMVLEPMGVFGGAVYRLSLKSYIRSLTRIHLLLSIVVCLLLGLAAAVAQHFVHNGSLPGALAGITVASPCILFFWMTRRSFYLQLSPSQSAKGAAVYFVVVIGGLFAANYFHILSPFTAYVLMGLAAVTTSLILLAVLNRHLPPDDGHPGPAQTWQKHWNYGRWALASSLASWVPAYVYYPLLGSFSGMARTGELRSLMNFVMPLVQAQAALSLLIIPFAARVCSERGKRGAISVNLRITVVSLAAALSYWGIVIPFRSKLFHLLYSGHYDRVANLVPWIAVGSIFWTAAYGSSVVLRAMEAPNSIFVAFAAASVVSLVIGVPGTWFFGLKGAIWGMNISDIVAFGMVVFLLWRRVLPERASALLSSG